MESEDYQYQDIIRLMKRGKLIKEDFYCLPVDHPLRLQLYDIEQAEKKIQNKQLKRIYQLLLEQKNQNEMAKDLHTYEMDIHRKIKDLAKALEHILNREK